MLQDLTISKIRHPEYFDSATDWQLWRDTYKSGWRYVNKYLEQFSLREDPKEFEARRRMTPPPAFAKAAINDVVNNIFQRMMDIVRADGPKSYQECLNGMNGGVDLLGASMNYFIGKRVLPELLILKRCGVYIDMPPISGATLLDIKTKNIRPYLYLYTCEEILNWQNNFTDDPNEYRSLLLKETYDIESEDYNMPTAVAERYRYMYLGDDGFVHCEFYDEDINAGKTGKLNKIDEKILPLTRIPFVMFNIPHSLLEDAARYQIALLNMISSDIWYCIKANFPFYTEQFDVRGLTPFNKTVDSGQFQFEGTSKGQIAGQEEVQTGVQSGRRYPVGLDRPGFIHPSPEPLQASMSKQEQMKAEIRQLINLSVANVAPAAKQQSSDSKEFDNQGLEAGLSAIGLELERGERLIAQFWGDYGASKTAVTIFYPLRYNLKSDGERRQEAQDYIAIIPDLPSVTAQKELMKAAINCLIGHKVPRDTLIKAYKEVDTCEIVAVNPELIINAVIAGILDKANAAKAFLYPDDAVEKANKEHADRLSVIAQNQTQGAGAARGVQDGSADPLEGKKERELANDTTQDPTPQDKSRGGAK